MDTLWQDLRYAARGLGKNRGFVAVVVATLAVGIGANTAIYSLVDTLYLRPLPIRDPDRVVMLMGSRGAGMFSYPNYLDYRAHNGVFDGLVASRPLQADLQVGDAREPIRGLLVSDDYFDVLGVVPSSGRTFRAGDGQTASTPVVLISDRLWQRRFGADPRIVGQTVRLNDTDFRIIGVVADAFSVDAVSDPSVEIWAPLRPGLLGETRAYANRDTNWLWLQGRLKPGLNRGQAQTAVDGLTRRLAEEYPMNEGVRVSVLSERQWRMRRRSGGDVVLLFLAAVGCLLLLACANITNLLLARGHTRTRELSVRAALGATRGRLARQLLTESLFLALLGGAAGGIVGHWTMAGLRSLASVGGVTLPDGIGLDQRVLVFTTVLSLGAALLFGLAPALQAARANLVGAIKGGGGTGLYGRRRFPFMKSLVVAQVAIAFVLLVSTGLFARSLSLIWKVDLGFRPERLIWTRVDLRPLRYEGDRSQRVFREIVERLRQRPGVASAALGVPPMAGYPWTNVAVGGARDPRETYFTTAGPRYFATLGLNVKGREFEADDVAGAPPVVIINERLARRFWPEGNALGQRLRPFADGPEHEVVGIVPDVRSSHWRPADPLLYLPSAQRAEHRAWVIARADGDPSGLRETLRQAALDVDSRGAVSAASTFDDAMRTQIAEMRFATTVLGTLGTLGLALAALGLYGVMSYTVGRATREIGIRAALGAEAAEARRSVLHGAARLLALGIAAGIGLALASTRLLQNVVVGSTGDPATLGTVAAVLVGIGLFAAYVPARRAARLDPVRALHHE